MQATVQKVGDGFALMIPADDARALGLADGEVVGVSRKGASIELHDMGGPTLAELLEKVTPETLHGEWDTGRPVGKEIW